jgi:hypothetical protein
MTPFIEYLLNNRNVTTKYSIGKTKKFFFFFRYISKYCLYQSRTTKQKELLKLQSNHMFAFFRRYHVNIFNMD